MKHQLKQLIWAATRHIPGNKKDIALISSRRSGSTWFMEILAVADRVRYIDQPFSLFRATDRHAALLPAPFLSQFIHMSETELSQIKSFITYLLNGSLQVNAPWDPRKQTFHLKTDRIVLKILDAKPIVPWIADNFALEIVYSTRHPIPTALSIIRNGWGLTAEAYLQNVWFREEFLDSVQIKKCESILQVGCELEKHVLNWTLENLIMLRSLPDRPDWTFIDYESAILDPSGTALQLASRLSLEGVSAMTLQSGKASRSTKQLSSVIDVSKNTMGQLKKWKEHVTLDEARTAMDVLKYFNIDLYNAESHLPIKISIQNQLGSGSVN